MSPVKGSGGERRNRQTRSEQMAYFTELEIRMERSIRNTEGGVDKVALSQKVKFDPEQVPFGGDDSTFTIEEAADTLRGIVTDKFDAWAAPKQAPKVIPRSVARPPEEPEYEDEPPEEEPREQKRSLSPFKKKRQD